MIKYIVAFIVMTVIGILYDKYKTKQALSDNKDNIDIIRKYLLNDDALLGNKPIIWVHIDYETNGRQWLSFGSRNTKQLNQPYLYITIKSIINHCGSDFNVCLIDDNSFSKLIPGWSIDLNNLANPVKQHIRSLALTKILYYFGGMLVPNSYLALQNLQTLYSSGLKEHSAFVMETVDRGNTATNVATFPNHTFMGCKKNSDTIKDLMLFMERLDSTDYTNEMDFLGQINRYCFSQVVSNKMKLIDGKYIGTKCEDNKPVYVDELMQSSYVNFDDELQGIYIPSNELLLRTKFGWFVRMSPKQIFNSNVILGKYMLLSN